MYRCGEICEEGFILAVSTSTAPISGLVLGTSTERLTSREAKIINFLKKNQTQGEGNVGLNSEIFTDRLSAAFEIISPMVITEGLRTDYVSALFESILFKSDVVFFGRPYFTTDTAGFAVIKAGATEVTVTFEREYLEKPIINASMATKDGLESLNDSASIQAFFGKDIRFIIGNASTTGFTIFLNKPTDEDVPFNWVALAVKGAKKFESTATSTNATTTASSTTETEPVAPELPVYVPPTDETEDNATTTEETVSSPEVIPPSEPVVIPDTPLVTEPPVSAPVVETPPEENPPTPSESPTP